MGYAVAGIAGAGSYSGCGSMIRFACPGCSATFSVPDEKAGKHGKCPTCLAEFVIPDADPSAPPPLPGTEPPPLPDFPAPAAKDSAFEIKPCPGCGGRLSVAPADLGSQVECPYCKTTFRSLRAVSTAPAPPPAPPKVSDFEHTDDAGRPKQKRETDDDDDDRPSRRRRRALGDDDDDDDDRPRLRRRNRAVGTKPEKVNVVGGMMLAGGIIALLVVLSYTLLSTGFCCLWPGTIYGLVVGILLIVRGSNLLGNNPGPAPHGLAVCQIILIINFDVFNLILGILAKVFLNDPEVKAYFEESDR
jgi:hypothetical protein